MVVTRKWGPVAPATWARGGCVVLLGDWWCLLSTTTRLLYWALAALFFGLGHSLWSISPLGCYHASSFFFGSHPALLLGGSWRLRCSTPRELTTFVANLGSAGAHPGVGGFTFVLPLGPPAGAPPFVVRRFSFSPSSSLRRTFCVFWRQVFLHLHLSSVTLLHYFTLLSVYSSGVLGVSYVPLHSLVFLALHLGISGGVALWSFWAGLPPFFIGTSVLRKHSCRS